MRYFPLGSSALILRPRTRPYLKILIQEADAARAERFFSSTIGSFSKAHKEGQTLFDQMELRDGA